MTGWEPRLATSTLHKAIRRGDAETAAYAAAFLSESGYQGTLSAWRRVLAVPAEDLNGFGVEKVVAFYQAWNAGHELDHLFAAILYLCGVVKEHGLDRTADELKNAALYWVNGGRDTQPPEYAFDCHSGHGTVAQWWEQVNAQCAPSQWREDAMKYNSAQKKEKTAQGKLL